jgi:hypothetical protein
MDGIFAALFMCLFVLVLAIVGSAVAMWLVTRSVRRRITSGDVALVPLATDAALSGSGLSLEEARELRNVFMRTVAPRPEEIYYWARSRYPDATPDELATKIIQAEAHKCGFVGFTTGFPGAFALPLTLPVDLYLTGRLQASMIQALVYVYAREIDPDDLARVKWMVLLGGGSLANSLTQFLLKVVGGSTVRAFPILGAVAAYAANYFLSQAAGRAAMAHLSGAIAGVDTGRLITQAQAATQRLGATTGQLVRALPERLPLPGLAAPAEVLHARQVHAAPTPANVTPAPVEPYLEVGQTVTLETAVFPTPEPAPHVHAEGDTAPTAGAEPDPQGPTQEDASASAQTTCLACAQPNPADYRFCIGCGGKLEGVA